jgi:hypothetical protein
MQKKLRIYTENWVDWRYFVAYIYKLYAILGRQYKNRHLF